MFLLSTTRVTNVIDGSYYTLEGIEFTKAGKWTGHFACRPVLVILSKYPLMRVRSLKIAWKLLTRRWILQEPNLPLSCSDLTKWNGISSIVPVIAAQGDMPSLVARFMGPAWGPPGADRTQVGPVLAPRTFLSGILTAHHFNIGRQKSQNPFSIYVITTFWAMSLRHYRCKVWCEQFC